MLYLGRVWTPAERHAAGTVVSDRELHWPEILCALPAHPSSPPAPTFDLFIISTVLPFISYFFFKDPMLPFTSEFDGKGTVLQLRMWSNAMVKGEALIPLGGR